MSSQPSAGAAGDTITARCAEDIGSPPQDPATWRHQYRTQMLHAILVTRTIVAPYCVICAGPVVPLALTNTCLHQFCFECLAQWTTITPECPLCKCNYQTVLYDVRSVDDYKELQFPASAAHYGYVVE